MAYIVMAYTVMAYTVMACIVMAQAVMACIVMACIVMACIPVVILGSHVRQHTSTRMSRHVSINELPGLELAKEGYRP